MIYSRWTRSIPACAGETLAGAGRGGTEGVYPRVCGGNRIGDGAFLFDRGLSPRVRGKPPHRRRPGAGAGSIPACAGETGVGDSLAHSAQVYPRVCGGNGGECGACQLPPGLSPRVRGKPGSQSPRFSALGSIPACAGETTASPRGGCGAMVYPRVCGGNTTSSGWKSGRVGLSPRVRGKPPRVGGGPGAPGSIPACAGETLSQFAKFPKIRVYPRVCGGNRWTPRPMFPSWGLSPRVRGKPAAARPTRNFFGSIPACAGETRTAMNRQRHTTVYPRVCGGNPRAGSAGLGGRGLSPRVRGKQAMATPDSGGRRSIPACAGETISGIISPRLLQVYPRVCGGNLAPLE